MLSMCRQTHQGPIKGGGRLHWEAWIGILVSGRIRRWKGEKWLGWKSALKGHQGTVKQWRGLASWRRAFEDAGRRRRGPPKSCLTAAGPESLFGLVPGEIILFFHPPAGHPLLQAHCRGDFSVRMKVGRVRWGGCALTPRPSSPPCTMETSSSRTLSSLEMLLGLPSAGKRQMLGILLISIIWYIDWILCCRVHV